MTVTVMGSRLSSGGWSVWNVSWGEITRIQMLTSRLRPYDTVRGGGTYTDSAAGFKRATVTVMGSRLSLGELSVWNVSWAEITRIQMLTSRSRPHDPVFLSSMGRSVLICPNAYQFIITKCNDS